MSYTMEDGDSLYARITKLDIEKEFYKDCHNVIGYKLFLEGKEFKARIAELEKENKKLKEENEKYCAFVSDLDEDLQETYNGYWKCNAGYWKRDENVLEEDKKEDKKEDKTVRERIKLSPKAKKLAKQWQLDEEDLAQVTPTGANNTIKGDDLTELIEAAKKAWAEESSDESTDEDTDDERRICRTCGFESNDYTDFEHDRCQKCFDEQYQAWRDENGYKSDDPDNERDFYDVLDKRDRDERDKSKNKDKQDK